LHSSAFELPMSRRDIADHLGLSMETVSPTLMGFASGGLVELPRGTRQIVLVDKAALHSLQAGLRSAN